MKRTRHQTGDRDSSGSSARRSSSRSMAGTRLPLSDFKEPVGSPDDRLEREADRVAHTIVRSGSPGAGGWANASLGVGALGRGDGQTIRRELAEGATTEEMTPAATTETTSEPATATSASALLVDDESEVGRGQMGKSDFLSALRAEICAAVDGALSGTGRDSQGCPWIDHWLGYYAGRSASQIEASLLRYAPDARGAASANDYIAFVTARVRRSAETYATTGEISGVPDDMPISSMAGGGVLSALGGMFFKARSGGARSGNPVSVRHQLGEGRPLPGQVRSQMESAFGTSFGDVRLHADASSANLSDRLNARAFAIGRHVAFGAGEFRPGTLEGDALIAHELAHVVQQKGPSAPPARGASSEARLEEDADRSAHGAMLSSLGISTSRGMGQLRTGLRLLRCSQPKAPAAADPKLLQDFAAKFADAAALVRKSAEAMQVVTVAQAAGAEFGGYAEEGPAQDTWAYTVGNKVFIPKAHTDPVLAMRDFLFELNNATRVPAFEKLKQEAAKGSTGTLTAKAYARGVVEQEIEALLSVGKVWSELRDSFTEQQRETYDNSFYQQEYNDFKAGRKTKDDIVKDALQRVYTSGVDKGKTVEQFYMDQYNRISGGK